MFQRLKRGDLLGEENHNDTNFFVTLNARKYGAISIKS